MRYNNVGIKGIGAYLPPNIRTAQDIEQNAPTSEEWMYDKLGIKTRRNALNQTPSDLGVKAALKAIKNAGLSKHDIDMIIVATSSGEKISPSTACIIHNKLNLNKSVPSFDVNAVCAGFVYALSIACPLITTKTYKNILVIGTETYSKITDWDHRNCVFFGDGAGAVVIGESNKGWMSVELNANGQGTGMTGFSLDPGKTYITNPKEVWNQAVTVLPPSIKEILFNNNLSPKDIDHFIPHQASINMLKLIAKKVGLEEKKLRTVMDKYANIAGASIPIVLDDINKQNLIKPQQKLLLTAIGSGWAWGSIIINYENE
jgi:3-oxoacyl-[acyl-carrier-protein] synthase III